MKKLILILIAGCVVAAIVIMLKPVKNEFQITGYLENIPDGAIINLYRSDDDLLKTVASDTVAEGKFILQDTITSTIRRLYLTVDGSGFPNRLMYIWVAPGSKINITGNNKLYHTWRVESRIAEQKYENEFIQQGLPQFIKMLELSAKETDLIINMFADTTLTNEQKRDIWSEIENIRQIENKYRDSIDFKVVEYMKDAPKSIVWFNRMEQYAEYQQYSENKELIKAIEDLYHSRVDETDKLTDIGKNIAEYYNIGALVDVGDKMADGIMYDIEGTQRTLSELNGRYILLVFWSQGCGYCIQSIPELEEIINNYTGVLEVVSISEDGKDSWQEFVKKRDLKGNQWNELREGRTGLAAQYKVNSIPHYVLISPEGVIQSKWTGYAKNSLINKLKEEIK